MSCRITRKNGKIDKVLAPNGSASNLYKEIKNYLTEESAKEIAENNAYIQARLSDGTIRDASPSEVALGLWSMTYTPGFKAWFGNSKVVDDNGEPLLLFHGSPESFNTFDETRGGEATPIFTKGFFFTPDLEYAKEFQRGSNNLYPVYLYIEDPYYADRPLNRQEAMEIFERYDNDGIIGEEIPDSESVKDKPVKVFVTPQPSANNIKSVFNSGSFLKIDDNIYHSLEETDDRRETTSEIKARIFEFMQRAGFDIKSMDEYADSLKARGKDFNREGINALVDFLNGVVALKKGVSDYSFIEEAAHIAVELTEDSPMLRRALELVTETGVYNEYSKFYRERYKKDNPNLTTEQLEHKVRKEILGKLIADHVLTNNPSNLSYRFFRTLKAIWDRIVKKFQDNPAIDELQTTIQSISDNMLSASSEMANRDISISDTYYSAEEVDSARKTLQKVIDRLTNRLKDLKSRTSAKRTAQKLEEDIRQLQDKLDAAENQVGLLKFIGFVQEDVRAAKSYIEDVIAGKKSLSSKQVLMLQDFILYYTPLLHEIKRGINTGKLFQDLSTERRAEQINVLKSYISAFDDIKDFYEDAHAGLARENIKEFFDQQGWEIDFDLDKAFSELPQDAWALQVWFGSIRDLSSDLARTIYGMVGRVIQSVNRQATEVGRDLINKVINELGVKDTTPLAEVDSNGNTTGFFKTMYRLGEFYKDYDEFMDGIKERYGLEENQREPSDPKEALAYRKEINKYLSENTERKYTKEFYDLQDNLSIETREALLAFDIQRQDILSRAKNENGDIDYYLLTNAQYERLREIDIEKRKLAKTVHEDGTKKTGLDLKIAEELKEFNEKKNEKIDYSLRREAFEAARRQARSSLSEEEYKKWEERNKEIIYDKVWWDTINSLEKKSYSPEVQRLNDKKSELLSPYRDSSMQVQFDKLPEVTRKEVERIDKLIAEIRKNNPDNNAIQDFWKHAKIEPTKYFLEEQEKAKQEGTLKEFTERTHYINHKGKSVPYSYWTHIVPKQSKYILEVPSKNWNDLSRDSVFYNRNYDENWIGIQPKISKWSNPDYDKLSDNQKKALEILIAQKIKMNEIIPISVRNTYMLPQISKDLNDLLGQKDITVSSLKELIKDNWTSRVDDDEFGNQNLIERPDNTVGNYVPVYYTKMLENPANVSTDLVSSMIMFSKMAINFREMNEIAPKVEVVKQEFGRNIKYRTKNDQKPGYETNVYKMIETFIDMQVYGRRKEKGGQWKVPFTNKVIDVSKALNNVNSYIRANNLMFNVFTILSGFFNGVVNSSIETITGKYISKLSSQLAAKEWAMNLPDAISEVKKVTKTNKVNVLLEHFRVLENFDNVFDNLDKDKFLRYTKEDLVYMGYGLGDYALKANAALAVMFNYRLYEGKFYTEEQFSKINSTLQFKELTSVYDMYEVKDGKFTPKKEYKQHIDSSVEDYLEYTMKITTARIDGVLSDLDRTKIHQSIWGQLVATHRGWLIRGLADRWKRKGRNYMTGEIEVGSHREFGRLLLKTFMEPNRLQNLKELITMGDSLEPYQKEAVARTMFEIIAVLSLAIVAGLINGASDEEDDNYALEFAAYLSNRVLLETSSLSLTPTPLPYSEILTVLNSPVAGTKQLETIQDIFDIVNWDTIERGPYKGMPRAAKVPLKLTPGIKGLMQLRDPDSANQFLKNKPLKWHPSY